MAFFCFSGCCFIQDFLSTKFNANINHNSGSSYTWRESVWERGRERALVRVCMCVCVDMWVGGCEEVLWFCFQVDLCQLNLMLTTNLPKAFQKDHTASILSVSVTCSLSPLSNSLSLSLAVSLSLYLCHVIFSLSLSLCRCFHISGVRVEMCVRVRARVCVYMCVHMRVYVCMCMVCTRMCVC